MHSLRPLNARFAAGLQAELPESLRVFSRFRAPPKRDFWFLEGPFCNRKVRSQPYPLVRPVSSIRPADIVRFGPPGPKLRHRACGSAETRERSLPEFDSKAFSELAPGSFRPATEGLAARAARRVRKGLDKYPQFQPMLVCAFQLS